MSIVVNCSFSVTVPPVGAASITTVPRIAGVQRENVSLNFFHPFATVSGIDAKRNNREEWHEVGK